MGLTCSEHGEKGPKHLGGAATGQITQNTKGQTEKFILVLGAMKGLKLF